MTNINISSQDIKIMALVAISEAETQTQVANAITEYAAYSTIVSSIINRAATDGPPNYGNTIEDVVEWQRELL